MFDPTSCRPRGRWMLLKYAKAYGDVTSTKAFIYEVVAVGAGFPTDTSDPEYFAPGDHVLVDQSLLIQLGSDYAYANFDEAVLARWNMDYDEPSVFYSSVFAEAVYFPSRPGVYNFGDVIKVRVLDKDSAVSDIENGDLVLVPRSRAFSVGYKVNTRFIFRAEDVLGFCNE